jgi:hypothetical protein
MSRRRIRSRVGRFRCSRGYYISNVYPLVNPRTGDLELRAFSFLVEPRDTPHVELYNRAHRLMPPNYIFDPNADGCEVQRALHVLLEKDAQDTSEDEVLGALAVLGHSPCQASFLILGRLAKSETRYGSVARMALCECTGMAGIRSEVGSSC